MFFFVFFLIFHFFLFFYFFLSFHHRVRAITQSKIAKNIILREKKSLCIQIEKLFYAFINVFLKI